MEEQFHDGEAKSDCKRGHQLSGPQKCDVAVGAQTSPASALATLENEENGPAQPA